MKKVSEKELWRRVAEKHKEKGLPPLPERDEVLGFVDWEEDEIYISPKTPTTKKIHELWHWENPSQIVSPREMVDNEVEAELYAWEVMGRSPTIMVGIPAAVNLMETWPSRYTPRRAISLVIGRCRHFGIPELTWAKRQTFEASLDV